MKHETRKINRDINRPNRLKKTRTEQNRIRRHLEIVNETGRADAPNNTLKNVLSIRGILRRYQGCRGGVPLVASIWGVLSIEYPRV